ncbi:MAG: oligosaccharide flippase family protein [Candidatus Hydrothermia bacterium]
MRKGFLRDNLLTFSARIAGVLFYVFFGAIVGRVLGPDGKGIVSLSLMVVTYTSTIGTLGVDYGLIFLAGKRRESLKAGVAALLWTCSVSSVVLCILLWVLGPWRKFAGLAGLNDTLWLLTIIAVPLSLFSKSFQEIFRAKGNLIGFNAFDAGRSLLSALLALPLVWWLGFGKLGAVLTVPLRDAILVIVGLVALWPVLSLAPKADAWKKVLSFGFKASLGNALQFLNYRLDAFIVAYFIGSYGVGIYSVAVGLAELLWFVSGSVALVLFPRAAALPEDEAKNLAASATRITQFITLIGAIILAALGWLAIWIVYGPQFSSSYLPLLLILPGIWLFGYGKLSVSYQMGMDKPLYGTYLTVFSLVLMVPLDLLMIPGWGVSGASIASTIVYSLGGFLGLWWFVRHTRLPLSAFLLPRKEDWKVLRGAMGK